MAADCLPATPIHLDSLLERVDGDWTLIAMMLEIYQGQAPLLFGALDRAMASGSLDATARAAHGMASSLGALSAGPVFEAVRQLERAARQMDAPAVSDARAALDRETPAFNLAIVALASECQRRLAVGA